MGHVRCLLPFCTEAPRWPHSDPGLVEKNHSLPVRMLRIVAHFGRIASNHKASPFGQTFTAVVLTFQHASESSGAPC